MRDTGPRSRQLRDRGVVQVHGVGEPHVRAQPAQGGHILHRSSRKAFPAVLLLVQSLAEVGVQPNTFGAGEFGRFPHQLSCHRERRAG